jgi:hypothetical protein
MALTPLMLRDEKSANRSQRIPTTTRDWLLRRNSGEVVSHPFSSAVVSSRLISPLLPASYGAPPARSTRGQTESLTSFVFHPPQRQCISGLFVRVRVRIRRPGLPISSIGVSDPLGPGEVKSPDREHSAAGPTVTRTARTRPRPREPSCNRPAASRLYIPYLHTLPTPGCAIGFHAGTARSDRQPMTRSPHEVAMLSRHNHSFLRHSWMVMRTADVGGAVPTSPVPPWT